MTPIEEANCSWCKFPGAVHEGGADLNSGPISGIFCDNKCFRSWLQWNYSWEQFLMKKEQKKEQPEKEE